MDQVTVVNIPIALVILVKFNMKNYQLVKLWIELS